jgi:hypothetical protein
MNSKIAWGENQIFISIEFEPGQLGVEELFNIYKRKKHHLILNLFEGGEIMIKIKPKGDLDGIRDGINGQRRTTSEVGTNRRAIK